MANPARKPIPIFRLTFSATKCPNLPGPGGRQKSSCTARSEDDREHDRKGHEIAYLPWLRWYRITFHTGNPTQPPITIYLHDHWVMTAEPMDGAATA